MRTIGPVPPVFKPTLTLEKTSSSGLRLSALPQVVNDPPSGFDRQRMPYAKCPWICHATASQTQVFGVRVGPVKVIAGLL